MANPFFRNHWNPIRHGHYNEAQLSPQPTKPTVINIPVDFVGSENATRKQSPEAERMAAAVTIQRTVRGFLVRKNVRVVRQVAKEVEEIERKLREEKAKMIALDAKERLLVSEMLLALLLRLDSVRGVRDIRKKVIRRVISLQEAIDSNADDQKDHENAKDQTFDLREEANDAETELEAESPEKQTDLIMASDVTEGSIAAGEEIAIDQSLDPDEETNEMAAGIEIVEDESKTLQSEKIQKFEEEGASMAAESLLEVEEKRREERGMRKMAEKMAAENEVLKGMVEQLCTTSSEQCRLMKGLVERVEQLERVVHHRMDRRKKRRSAK